jgi:hypothetical protein
MSPAVFRPVRDPQTYRNLAYLALALPLGLAELAFLAAGLALALLLLITLVGVAVLAKTVDGAFALARVERRLASGLLRAQIPAVPGALPPPGAGVAGRLRVQLCCGTTWRRLAFLTAKLPLATATFALAGGAVTGGLALLALALYGSGLQALAAGLAAAVAVPAALHLVNALAALWARLGAALLPAAA